MKWSKLMEENREVIVEKMVEAFKEAEGGMSGWSIGVEMDQDGDVWTTGLMSQGSQSESSWKGETTIIDNIGSWNLDYDEMELLKAKLPDFQDLYDEFEQHKIDEDDEWISLSSFMSERYPNTLNEWNDEMTSFEVDTFGDYASEKLDNIIRMQKEHETYEGEDAQF